MGTPYDDGSTTTHATSDQARYGKIAGVVILARLVLEMLGDYPTILARGGETFAQTARFVVENEQLWTGALLAVAIAWIGVAVVGFLLYAVLEPVNKRVAQLALILRVAACAVGSVSLMLRVAKERLHLASATGNFSVQQLTELASTVQRSVNAGVYIAWICIGVSSVLFFLLFLRSRLLPRALAAFVVFTGVLLATVAMASFAYPQFAGRLKPLLVLSLVSEIATALWLIFKSSSWTRRPAIL